MSDERWSAIGDSFREAMKRLNDETETTLRRAMPSNGDPRRKRQPDPAARLHSLGERLRARRRQQMMRGLAFVTAVSFLAGWLGGLMAGRGRSTGR